MKSSEKILEQMKEQTDFIGYWDIPVYRKKLEQEQLTDVQFKRWLLENQKKDGFLCFVFGRANMIIALSDFHKSGTGEDAEFRFYNNTGAFIGVWVIKNITLYQLPDGEQNVYNCTEFAVVETIGGTYNIFCAFQGGENELR